ncbi:MAG: hypothetical protein ACOX0I_00260 [Bacilli bacterium]|jgi:hypothetical protein
MKKTALSLSLLLALLTGSIVGCGKIKPVKLDGEEVIFKVGSTQVTVSDILGFDEGTETSACAYDLLNTPDGTKAVYEAVYKVLAQQNVPVSSAIEGAVKEKMDDWADEVARYANTNGVTVRNATKTLLEQKGFNDEKELEASYLLDEQKEELANMYANTNTEPNIDAATGTTSLERYVTNTSPMIIKQILTKISSTDTLATKATISEAEVDRLSTVMKRLALSGSSSNSFKNIAYEESEDGSKTHGGNLGIMDSYTPFVPEFKLGLYVSEIIQNQTAWKGETYDADDTLAARPHTEDLFGANGVYANYTAPVMNVAAVVSALSYAEKDLNLAAQAAAGHEKEEDYDAQLYPRNVLYNKYFNMPTIQYLKLDFANIDTELTDLVKEMYPTIADDAAEVATKVSAIKAHEFYVGLQSEHNKLNDDKLIIDDNDTPIILVKSTHGLHWISVTWSALDQAAPAAGKAADAVKYFMYGSNASAIETTTYIKESAFNFGYSNTTVAQNTRKNEVKGRVTNYLKGGYGSLSPVEELYKYEIYTFYYERAKAAGDLTITNTRIENAINDFISTKTVYQTSQIDSSLNNTWSSYIKSIEANQELRDLLY